MSDGPLERALGRDRAVAGALLGSTLALSGAIYLLGRDSDVIPAPPPVAAAVLATVVGLLCAIAWWLGAWLERGAAGVATLEEHLARRSLAHTTGAIVLDSAALFAALLGTLFGLHPWWALGVLAPVLLQVLAFPDRARAEAALAAFRAGRAAGV